MYSLSWRAPVPAEFPAMGPKTSGFCNEPICDRDVQFRQMLAVQMPYEV